MVIKKDDFIRVSVWLGFAVAAIGLAVFAGWALHLEYLTTPIPGYVSMKANTAISFACLGAALAILARQGGKENAVPRVFARALALVATTLGILNSIEYAASVDLGIDQLLFNDPQLTEYSPFPGRMSPVTSLNFVLFGLALFLYRNGRDRLVVNILTAVAGAFSLLGIIGAIFGVIPLVPLARYTNVAVHTSFAFVLLFLGIMFSQPDSWVTKVVSDEGAAGLLARWLLPAVIAVEISTGKLRLILRDNGLVTREYGAALSTFVNACVVIGFFVLAFRALKRSEDELCRHREHLEELVDERTAELMDINEYLHAAVAERQGAEDALRESEARFRGLVEESPVGVYIIQDWLYTYVNPRFAEIYGYTRDEIINKKGPLYMLLPGERAAVQESIRRRLAGEVRKVHYQARGHTKDGRVIYVEIFGTGMVYHGNNVIIGTMLDVTERRVAEETIRKMNEDLERRVEERTGQLTAVNRELEAFCYSVSHDLRSPLRSIDGFSQALMEDFAEKLDGKGRDCLTRVRAASQRMAQLIDDLLKLSRVTRDEMRHERIDLSALARSVAAELRATQPGRDVRFVIQDRLFADGDPRLMRVAVENLLGNAWKFTSRREQAKIEFGAAEAAGGLEFFVKDDGAGFDMAYKDKLFGPFQRLHSAADFQGTGIGLATVQRIIARHGGRVWAEGEVGKGAAFYFTIGQGAYALYKEAA